MRSHNAICAQHRVDGSIQASLTGHAVIASKNSIEASHKIFTDHPGNLCHPAVESCHEYILKDRHSSTQATEHKIKIFLDIFKRFLWKFFSSSSFFFLFFGAYLSSNFDARCHCKILFFCDDFRSFRREKKKEKCNGRSIKCHKNVFMQSKVLRHIAVGHLSSMNNRNQPTDLLKTIHITTIMLLPN